MDPDRTRSVRATHVSFPDFPGTGTASIEGTEWSNGEGLDVELDAPGHPGRRLSLTWSEADALDLVIARLRMREAGDA